MFLDISSFIWVTKRQTAIRLVAKNCLLFFVLLLSLPIYSFATESRGLRVVAKDQVTNQTGEVQLYNKSYAVVIGIDSYQNLPRDRQLKNAVKDAKGVEEVLGKNYRFDKIIHLYNQEATKDRILEVLTEELPAQMGEQDSLFLFWAGHGDQEGSQGKEIGYLIPYDGEIGKIRKNLTMTELRDTVSNKLPAKHVFYVMDACYGGLLASTRAVDKKSRRDLSYLKEITKENVRQVLTAGGKGEEVLDGGYKGHSVFTGRLVEALETAGDFITANEIQTILREKVYGDSKALGHGRTQTPAFGTLSGNGDYVFVPNLDQKSKDNSAELAKLEAELKRFETHEAETKKSQSEQQQREAEQKRKAYEARQKAGRLRQQQLAEESKRQQEMESERLRFEADQKLREQELTAAQKLEDQRLITLKTELARKKQVATPSTASGSLSAAVSEIKRLNGEIEGIEAAFGQELNAGIARITTRYDTEISNVQKVSTQRQQPLVRDEFETDAEFRVRSAKQQSSYRDRITELERKKQDEVSELEKSLKTEQQKQSTDLRVELKHLADKEFYIGGESLALELGQYDPEKQNFPVTIRNSSQSVKVAMNGVISLPRDSARKFKQEYSSGLVRPEMTVKAGNGNIIRVAMANDSDNIIYEYFDGEFITVAERKQREAAVTAERERRETEAAERTHQTIRSNKKNPIALIETSLGDIKVELFNNEAPLSVKNFLDYATSGFYSGTIFHRVIPGFMAQGGGFTADRKQKPANAPVKNEAANGLKNDRGTIAMARTSAPDSATAQFFINVVSNNSLNRPNPDGAGYTVFGKVVEGMDVVDKIVSVKTQNVNMVFQNFPDTPVVIKSVKAGK